MICSIRHTSNRGKVFRIVKESEEFLYNASCHFRSCIYFQNSIQHNRKCFKACALGEFHRKVRISSIIKIIHFKVFKFFDNINNTESIKIKIPSESLSKEGK